MELAQPLPSDAQLVDAARRGSDAAWAELDSRHGWAVLSVAKALRVNKRRRSGAEAMERLHRALVEDEPAVDGVSAVRALRPRAIAELTAGTYRPAGDRDPDDAAEDGLLADVFGRLPEPWQTVLWHSVVEQRSPGEMTPLLGRGVNDVLALQHTARSGLHRAYLRAIAEGDGAFLADDCRTIVPMLSAAGRGTLAAQDQRVVDAHLESGRDGAPCDDCRARLDLVATIDERLPAAIAPGITGLSVERYRAAVGAGDQSFGVAALSASRSNRVGKLAVAGAAVVILVAVVFAFLLIRRPFDEASSSTSAGPGPTGTVATTAEGTIEPPDTNPGATAAPTTTELLLRPSPSGPANTVELLFSSGSRAVGAVAPLPDVSVDLVSPARVFAGGTGTIDVMVTNSGESTEVSFEIRTPNGVLFDALVDGDAECRGPLDDAAFCNVALGAGESKTLALRLRLETTVVGRLILDPGVLGEPLEIGISATPRLVHSSVGRGDIVAIGNTVISCQPSAPACDGARALTGEVVNRWDLPMEFIGEMTSLGWRNSSTASLEFASGAEVEAAYLFWSGDLDERGQRVADDAGRGQVTMLAPNGRDPVQVESTGLLLGDIDATQYLGYAEVTDLVAAAGSGEYLVGNIQSVEVQGSYAAWSLVVVTSDDRQPRAQHTVTSPFAWFAPEFDHRSSLPVPFGLGLDSSLDVVAFEGEPGFSPERVVVGGTQLGGDNEFDGSIIGPRAPMFANSFGIDVEAYDLRIDAPDGTLLIDATSDKDGVRLAVLGLTVDLPS